jgi:CRISPR-associated protein Csb2
MSISSDMATDSTPFQSPYDNMLAFALPAGVRVDGRKAGVVTASVRKAVMSRVPDPLPPEISGHDAENKPHVAYLPLLDVGYVGAPGDVLGVGVLLPRNRTDLHGIVSTALTASMRTLRLDLPGARLWLEPSAGAGTTPLDLAWWSRPSRAWATVTPMVLDRFPGKGKEDEEIARACVHAGLPEPSAIMSARDPLVPGGASLGRSNLPRQETTPRPFTHVRLHFPNPVPGPILLGAQRYLGMGLCAPTE